MKHKLVKKTILDSFKSYNTYLVILAIVLLSFLSIVLSKLYIFALLAMIIINQTFSNFPTLLSKLYWIYFDNNMDVILIKNIIAFYDKTTNIVFFNDRKIKCKNKEEALQYIYAEIENKKEIIIVE